MSKMFRVKNGLSISPIDLQNDPPLNPQVGDLICDSSDNNKIKRYDANAAAWVEVGSGGIGGVDIFFVQDFESASLSSFTQTGLVLSQTDPLKGKVSAVLNHQAAINQSFKQIIPVDRKFRGIPMVLRLDSKSNASQGNVTISIYDETNAASIVASEQLQLSNDTAGKKTSVAFTLPATCASFSYTITALPESGKVTRIDDIICEMAETALLETAVQVPVVTSWASYTPTFQGFGTPTNIEFEWRQVGESVEIRGKFTSGTSTAVEARIGLPAGLTSAGTSLIPSIQEVGVGSYNVVSALQGIILIEPSVTYLTIGIQATANAGLTKVNGSALLNSGNIFSFFASVPCAGLSATTTKAIPLTQSGLIQEADSMIRLSGANGFNGTKRLFSSIIQNIGNDISYIASTGQFIAQKAGIYNISWSEATSVNTTAMSIVLQLNNTDIAYDNQVQNTASTSAKYASVSWQGYLNQGGIITCNVNNTAEFNGLASTFTMSRAGSLKQLNVSSDQKITIPTSELRFEGASSRGSTATAIVRFDTQARLRGDAFEVNPLGDPAVLGTHIRMLKAGTLSANANIVIAANTRVALSLNQTTLTAVAPASEALATTGNGTGASSFTTASWTGAVKAGDIIRVGAEANPSTVSGQNYNYLTLAFQEQDISVSVTNTLPQFSESDSSVRVSGWAGVGSTGSKIGRYSGVLSNIGTAIEYVPSSINGDSFVVKESGIYNINSFFDAGSTAGSGWIVGLSVDSPNLAANIYDIPVANQLSEQLISSNGELASASWQGYLTAGQIVRAQFGNTLPASIDRASFTISKVGKPNVTGVDVTPFINVPQPDVDSIYLLGSTNSTVIQTDTFTSQVQNNTKGIISYTKDAVAGDRITLLKNAKITVSYTTLVSNSLDRFITVNGVNNVAPTAASTSVIAYSVGNSATQMRDTVSATRTLSAGDIIRFQSNGNGATDGSARVTITAEALSDQILTAPETFSTDTAALSYASSAAYTLSTLQNAPVGTYITFTAPANSTTRTQTTLSNRPTQTDADMNANGILLYAKPWNIASTSAQPASIAIQIGKGLKGVTVDLYAAAAKTTSIPYNSTPFLLGTTSQYGVFQNYNEKTGVLELDCTYTLSSAITSNNIGLNARSNLSVPNGYLVINASKNPSIVGFGLNRIAAKAVSSAGTSLPNNTATVLTFDSIKNFDTHNALNTATGVYTVPETGYYQVNCMVSTANVAWVIGQSLDVSIQKNGVTTVNYYTEAEASNTAFLFAPLSDIIYCAQGDSIRVIVTINRGAATNLQASGFGNCLSIAKISV